MVEKEVLHQYGVKNFELELIKHGHINRTYVVIENSQPRYILQRLNDYVFTSPQHVGANFNRINDHLGVSLRFKYNIPRPVIKNYVVNYKGYWRLFHFESNTHEFINTSNPDVAYKAARAYSNFDRSLSDLDSSKINTVIPNFHDLEFRDKNLRTSFEIGIDERKEKCKDLVEKMYSYQDIINEFSFQKSQLPVRVIHNDTKLSNLLFDLKDEVNTILDLDTVMPGIVITDFGDMVRSMCNPVGEGKDTINEVYFDKAIYNELNHGFIEGWEGELSQAEVKSMSLGAKAVIYEQAIRFLTDYLEGDVYYQINYPEENLVRTEVHLRLLESFLKQT